MVIHKKYMISLRKTVFGTGSIIKLAVFSATCFSLNSVPVLAQSVAPLPTPSIGKLQDLELLETY